MTREMLAFLLMMRDLQITGVVCVFREGGGRLWDGSGDKSWWRGREGERVRG